MIVEEKTILRKHSRILSCIDAEFCSDRVRKSAINSTAAVALSLIEADSPVPARRGFAEVVLCCVDLIQKSDLQGFYRFDRCSLAGLDRYRNTMTT